MEKTSATQNNNTEVRIFITNIKAVLLHKAETWETTVTIIKNVQIFVNEYVLKKLNVCWPDITKTNFGREETSF